MNGTPLRARRLGIDTHDEAVVYMRADCPVCRAEGFAARARIRVVAGARAVDATLSIVTGDLLAPGEAGLSDQAWAALGLSPGDPLQVAHPPPLASLTHLRRKMDGQRLGLEAMRQVIRDVAERRYSDLHLAAFLAACAGGGLDFHEVVCLTRAMIDAGDRLHWGRSQVVDKHCVGGLLGNRTSPIVVAIAAAHGLTIPKTSSRAITSPAGTADVMETLAPVDIGLDAMRRVVEREGGCVVWGGAVRLSPADELLIRVERALDIDTPGQLVASVLSKKIAAGSTHVVIDIPHGPSAKVRSREQAEQLASLVEGVGHMVGLVVRAVITDGSQPVGRGFGPALEAHDVIAVLRGEPGAPPDLRERSLAIAAMVLELSPQVAPGQGLALARGILEDGRAWRKLVAICEAQGGMREPPVAPLRHDVSAPHAGRVSRIDNRRLARIAKLAGAPASPAAGLELHVRPGAAVEPGQPLFTIHAVARGELEYALSYAAREPDVVAVLP